MANVNYVGTNYNLVEVTYSLGVTGVHTQTYVFKCDKDIDLIRGDLAVVESSRGYGLVEVLGVYEDIIENADLAKLATAWVVSKVDMTRHEVKKEASKRVEYIKSKLEEKKKSMEAFNMYAMLAQFDPEAAQLVDELKTLTLTSTESKENK